MWKSGERNQNRPRFRRGIRTGLMSAYVTGTEPVWLRVQFDPLAAGKSVFVEAWPWNHVNPPRTILTVSSNGECLVLAQLADGVNRSHLIFYCDGVRTVLPVMRAPLATVEANEAANRRRQ